MHGVQDTKAPERRVRVLSRQASRRVDELAVSRHHIPTIVLMENAARAIAAAVRGVLAEAPGAERGGVLIFCGWGNNGGDGLAAARHLANAGVPVAVVLAVADERFNGDSLVNLRIVRSMSLPVVSAGEDGWEAGLSAAMQAVHAVIGPPRVVVDALLGTGIDRPVLPPNDPPSATRRPGALYSLIALIDRLRQSGAMVVAVDTPSGLDVDTGVPFGGGMAVRADLTICLVAIKRGFTHAAAAAYTGRLLVGEIGVPARILEELGEWADVREGVSISDS